jgi:hypothetical protein
LLSFVPCAYSELIAGANLFGCFRINESTRTFVELCVVSTLEVPGSTLGSTRFSEQQCVWNGVHSALVRINEELLGRKVSAPV